MECLHGVPAASVITKNGKFWRCDDKYYKSCEFFCPDQDRSLFETSLSLWKTNGAPRPMCHVHQEPAKMRVVKNVAKQNFGRPFFVCSNRENPCSFWEWGDQVEIPRPKIISHSKLVNQYSNQCNNSSKIYNMHLSINITQFFRQVIYTDSNILIQFTMLSQALIHMKI